MKGLGVGLHTCDVVDVLLALLHALHVPRERHLLGVLRSGLKIEGLGLRVWVQGSGFRFWGLVFGVWCLGVGVEWLGFRVQGPGLRVQG